MGLGLLWILYARWWSGMRVIFILQFLCVMSGIYWHLTRRGAHCAPANLNRQYFFQWSRIGQTATGRCLSSSCGLCGIANHSIYNAIACRACLSDHDKRLFWRIFLTHNPPNISEQRTAVRHHYSLFIVIYFLSQSAKSRARCGVCTGSCLISFTHC